MTDKRFSVGGWITDFLLGQRVGHSTDEKKSSTHRYQVRQNKLIAGNCLLIMAPSLWCVYLALDHSIPLGITIATALIIFFIGYLLAAASDAIFDSLHERINLQSTWLETRLDVIEELVSPGYQGREISGRGQWEQNNPSFIDPLDRAYFVSPERAHYSPEDEDAD